MTTAAPALTAEAATEYAEFITTIVRELNDDGLRAAGRPYFTPGYVLRDNEGNLRSLTECEAIAAPIIKAEYRRRFLSD